MSYSRLKPINVIFFYSGKESHHERWRVCISDTDSVLGFSLGAMFIQDNFDGESKPEAQVKYLRAGIDDRYSC